MILLVIVVSGRQGSGDHFKTVVENRTVNLVVVLSSNNYVSVF